MNDIPQERSLSTSFVDRVAPKVSPEVLLLVTLGQQRGWRPVVCGRAPFPDEPVRLGDWLIAPVHQDSSLVPARALERVQTIFAAGLRPKGFVVVHEAPKLLPAPRQQKIESVRIPALPTQLKSTLKLVCTGLGVLGGGLAIAGAAVLAVTALSIAAIVALPAFLIVGAIVVDPILVAVTEDGYWVEVDRWDS